jgi:hypothetical protein
MAVISYLDILKLFLLPSCSKTLKLQASCSNRTALRRIFTAGSIIFFMPHPATRALAEEDHLSGGRHGHLTSHFLIFVSCAAKQDP